MAGFFSWYYYVIHGTMFNKVLATVLAYIQIGQSNIITVYLCRIT